MLPAVAEQRLRAALQAARSAEDEAEAETL